ncbi:MAG: restriction endonuclease subunit S [Ligilactobacillus ruminis]
MTWKQRKFGDVVQVRRGLIYKPSDVQETGVRVLRSSNINEDTFVCGNDDVFVNPKTVNIDTVKQNDILITSANGSSRLVGKHALIKGIPNESAIHGGFMLLGRTKNYDFINASMNSSWYIRFINIYVTGGNGAIGNLSKSDLDEQLILVPSDLEQKKIGVYFANLDHLITLHQQKITLLTKLKKAMLEKMFPKKGSVIPEFRFNGFANAWEQRKLGDVLERRIEQRQQSKEYPRLAFASGQGVIPLSERKTNNREQLTKDEYTKKYLVTELNDIVYNPANVKYGAIDRNKCGRGLISPIYVTFTTSEISGFIERIVTSHDFQQRALRFEEGTVTKRQSVNPEDLVTLDILVASKREEQQKIATYFDYLDNLITLHQRKIDKIKNMKKAMLDQMFIY